MIKINISQQRRRVKVGDYKSGDFPQIGLLTIQRHYFNRLRAIWPKGYQHGSLRKFHQNGDYVKSCSMTKFVIQLLLKQNLSKTRYASQQNELFYL